MPVEWKVPTGDDLWKVVSRSVVNKANEDAAGGTHEGNDIEDAPKPSDSDTRADHLVDMAVEEIRAAIEVGRRTALSLTAGSVPPEAYRFALAIAAYELTSSPPSLQQVLLFDGGIYSPRQKVYDQAMRWLENVRTGGGAVTPPTDPDEDTAPAGIRWGDAQGRSTDGTAGAIDMKTDGPWPEDDAAD